MQRLANRLVYGERATPYEVMAGFSERVADTVSTDQVLPQMAAAAGRGVGAVEATVRVRLPGGLERVERWSSSSTERTSEPWSVEVAYQGEIVGDLTVAKTASDPLLTGRAGAPARPGIPGGVGAAQRPVDGRAIDPARASSTSRPRRCACRASAL